MKRYVLIITLLFILAHVHGAVESINDNFSRKGNLIEFADHNQNYRIEVCTPAMIRVRMAGPAGFAPDEHWMVTRYDWPEVKFSTEEKNGEMVLKTDVLTAKITKIGRASCRERV